MKVGKYDIPDLRLHPLLVDATRTLYENFKSDEARDMLAVANLLGHKTDKSGAFLGKIADLRSYGLIEKRGVKVTDLGKKLTYDPSDEERNKALKEALLNIPLWKELYSRFGVNLPTSNFWVELTKITGLEAPDAQKLENMVRNAYQADFQYIKMEKEPEKVEHKILPKVEIDTSMTTINIQAGRFSQTIPFTEEGLEFAKGFLDLLKRQIKPEKQIPEKEELEARR